MTQVQLKVDYSMIVPRGPGASDEDVVSDAVVTGRDDSTAGPKRHIMAMTISPSRALMASFALLRTARFRCNSPATQHPSQLRGGLVERIQSGRALLDLNSATKITTPSSPDESDSPSSFLTILKAKGRRASTCTEVWAASACARGRSRTSAAGAGTCACRPHSQK